MYKKLKGYFTLTRYSLVEFYIDKIKENFEIDNKHRLKAKRIEEELRIRINRIVLLSNYLIVIYVFAYFSFVSYFLIDIFIFQVFKEFVTKIVSVFGTTFFIVLIFILNYLRGLAYQDLNLLFCEFLKYYKIK